MLVLLMTTLALFSLGCSTSGTPENITQKVPADTTQSEMQHAAQSLVSGFMVNLKAELMSAVKEGGVASAISACELKAPQVADSFSREQWSIKRVTEKPRNISNKANLHEQEILELFADSLRKLGFIDEWTDPDLKTGYTYYQPIKMGSFCLKCHGQIRAIDEKVALALQDKYPEDQAINYRTGDLRGMFVVHIKSKEALPLLQQAMLDSL